MIKYLLEVQEVSSLIYLKETQAIDIGCNGFSTGMNIKTDVYLSFTLHHDEAKSFLDRTLACDYCDRINELSPLSLFKVAEHEWVEEELVQKDDGFNPVGIVVDEFKDFPSDPVSCAKAIVENVKRLLRRIYHYEKGIEAVLEKQQNYKNKLKHTLKYKGEMLQKVESFENKITKEAMEILHPMQEVKHPSKSLSEDAIKQKDEFYESQTNVPCKDCEIGLKERSVNGCAGCTNEKPEQKITINMICKDCGHFGNPEKCPSKDSNGRACPSTVFKVNDNERVYGSGPCCDSPGKDKCEQCQGVGLANPLNQG